jgi:hypothetical protein
MIRRAGVWIDRGHQGVVWRRITVFKVVLGQYVQDAFGVGYREGGGGAVKAKIGVLVRKELNSYLPL